MSLASATGQVIFSQKGGVYMPAIQCNQGDLYQEYMGEASAPTNIAPDFASLKPVLSFIHLFAGGGRAGGSFLHEMVFQ